MQVISYGSVTNAWAPDNQGLLFMKAEGQNLQLCLPFQPLTKLPPSVPTYSLGIFGIFLEAQLAKP